MPIIYEDALKKDVSSGHFAAVYMLYGEDAYLKQYYLKQISEKAYDGDPFFNLQQFEGDVDLQEVYDAVNQFPMMSDSKCVTLTDYDFEHCDADNLKRLCTLVEEVPAGCVFILRFESIEVDAKRSAKAKKLIAAVEKRGGRVASLDHRRPAALIKMLTVGAQKYGRQMDERTARFLLETVGEDISLLKNELYKLCGFVPEGGVIDIQTVEYVCTKSVDASIYDFAKQIFACDITTAIGMLDDMFFMRIEPIVILSTVSAAFVDAYRVFAGGKNGDSTAKIAADFGYGKRAFVLDRARANTRRLDDRKFRLCFEALLSADTALKSNGTEPRTVLEELTVRLVYIIGER